MSVDNSSHITLSETDDTAELTAIDADNATELSQLDGLHQPNPGLEGSFPENISSSIELPVGNTVSTEQQSDSRRGTNASGFPDAATSSDATGTLQDSRALAAKVLQDTANQTAAFAHNSGAKDDVSLPDTTEDAESQQTREKTEQQHPGQSFEPVTAASTPNVAGDAQPPSSTGFSTDAQQSHQNDSKIPSEAKSTPAASTDGAESLSAAVFNQTLYEEELAALSASVHHKSLNAPVLHTQDGEGRTYRQQRSAGDTASSQSDVGVQQPGTPDRSVDDRMRQSGHAEAFDHIMQSVPEFIRNADSADDVSHGSEQSLDDDAASELGTYEHLPFDAQTNASIDADVGNYAIL